MRELYPEVNIRVLYQKDLEDLQFKLSLGHVPGWTGSSPVSHVSPS
jgi:hypothetical protein